VPDGSRIQVNWELDDDLPIMYADPEQLDQVFTNLIRNAVQAMPEGGRLTIATAKEDADQVTASVADTGVGIPEETLKKVFEPLFTTRVRGIGLGLAIAKTLVEGHDGAIEVTSEVGEGTRFTVRLPLAREAGKRDAEVQLSGTL
jgi:two-component system NtrC family sensor kinase